MPETDQTRPDTEALNVAVVVPCYREKNHILDVLAGIGDDVTTIYVVDDACPDGTGDFVEENAKDPRIKVCRNPANQGVGGATLSGYRAALADGCDIIVKLDGDGQMDPALIHSLIAPIRRHEADYTKGNRLHRRDAARGMPFVRLLGNMGLTLMSKLSSGYWDIMDPTNGFTAIHADVARQLPIDDMAKGYFFESDMLFRLSGLNAVVRDVPMRARYGEEVSHLVVHRVFGPFFFGHLRNTWRRLIDTYFVREVGIASLELILGALLLPAGAFYGAFHWWRSIATGVPATAGTAILSAMPIIVGVQLLLAFIGHDTRRQPTQPIHLTDPDDI
ncbi:MAG: glycosyltransferase family 2 protein [Rhodospirillales bacterium]|nr:glycosyltransferase family 2 protein [Rhodospirillales bacterium]MBO6785943.1 glycosyltransferase family 2 protein [Rhodospirillales bacterium]